MTEINRSLEVELKPANGANEAGRLTRAELAELLDYDPETGFFTWKARPGQGRIAARRAGKRAETLTERGYARINIKGRTVRAHTLAWLWVHGEYPADILDHINLDRADNRIANLRACTTQQNCFNRTRASNLSGWRGVRRLGRKWGAQIGVARKFKWLGTFETAEDAARAYDAAAKEWHGEFGILNYPEAQAHV